MENKVNEVDNQEMTTLNGGVNEEQITLWKHKHGRVYEIEVEDPDYKERHVGYFSRPSMQTMQAASAAARGDELKASEIMFNNCWLGGSPALKEDAVYKMEAMEALSGIFGKCVHSLKNL